MLHIKCWKNVTNQSIASERTTASWRCSSCDPIYDNSEPIDSEILFTAQALNEMYTEDMLTPLEEESDFEPFYNVRDNYYDHTDLNNKNWISMCVNIRSLNNYNNFYKLDALVRSLPIKPHVIGINETWLSCNETGPHNNLNGYTFFYSGTI